MISIEETILRLLLGAIIRGVIGFEREIHGRAEGGCNCCTNMDCLFHISTRNKRAIKEIFLRLGTMDFIKKIKISSYRINGSS